MLAPLHGPNTLHGAMQMIEAERCLFEEPIAGWRWPDAGVIPLEELSAEAMFESVHASADSRVLDI
jgi:hypothetical protein